MLERGWLLDLFYAILEGLMGNLLGKLLYKRGVDSKRGVGHTIERGYVLARGLNWIPF